MKRACFHCQDLFNSKSLIPKIHQTNTQFIEITLAETVWNGNNNKNNNDSDSIYSTKYQEEDIESNQPKKQQQQQDLLVEGEGARDDWGEGLYRK